MNVLQLGLRGLGRVSTLGVAGCAKPLGKRPKTTQNAVFELANAETGPEPGTDAIR